MLAQTHLLITSPAVGWLVDEDFVEGVALMAAPPTLLTTGPSLMTALTTALHADNSDQATLKGQPQQGRPHHQLPKRRPLRHSRRPPMPSNPRARRTPPGLETRYTIGLQPLTPHLLRRPQQQQPHPLRTMPHSKTAPPATHPTAVSPPALLLWTHLQHYCITCYSVSSSKK